MFVGFDYGTSNCAMAHIVKGQSPTGQPNLSQPRLIPLYDNNCFVPSTLYALERPLIAEAIYQSLPEGDDKKHYAHSRASLLSQSRAAKMEHSLAQAEQGLFFGQEAIAQYIAAPSEGYFIKSPKSFLGASGLRQQSVDFFEDLVTAMMLNLKARAEKSLGHSIAQAVIGRPVNFQGINAQLSNQQAQTILLTAGKRAGFKEIEFLFEPLAAGFDFETRLTHNRKVLVVDVGGGTTDCSMVLMGPDHIRRLEREQDFLGHSGERIGGNDFDIQFAQKILMPDFGMLSPLKTGLPMPFMPFVNAMAVNDVGAQAEFYDVASGHLIEKLMRDTTEPQLLQRLRKMRSGRHNFAVVREAENGKIALSDQISCQLGLGFIESGLSLECTARQLEEASQVLLGKISALIWAATRQAGTQPDVVYVTGGSAKSPLIQKAIQQLFGEAMSIVDGDHFGSVVAGLSLRAQRIFAPGPQDVPLASR